jgi:hypothetical protein
VDQSGASANVKVALDYLNVVAVVVEESSADGLERKTIELADVPAAAAQLKALRAGTRKGRSKKGTRPSDDDPPF